MHGFSRAFMATWVAGPRTSNVHRRGQEHPRGALLWRDRPRLVLRCRTGGDVHYGVSRVPSLETCWPVSSLIVSSDKRKWVEISSVGSEDLTQGKTIDSSGRM